MHARTMKYIIEKHMQCNLLRVISATIIYTNKKTSGESFFLPEFETIFVPNQINLCMISQITVI